MSFRITAPSKQKLNSIIASQVETTTAKPQTSSLLEKTDTEVIGSLFDDDEKANGSSSLTTTLPIKNETKLDGFAVRISGTSDLL